MSSVNIEIQQNANQNTKKTHKTNKHCRINNIFQIEFLSVSLLLLYCYCFDANWTLSLYLSSYLTVFARARTAAQLVCIWTSEWITMWLLMSPTLTSQKNEELKTNWMDIVGSQFKCVWVSVFERVLLASYHSKCNGSESLCTLQCKLTVSLSLWL